MNAPWAQIQARKIHIASISLIRRGFIGLRTDICIRAAVIAMRDRNGKRIKGTAKQTAADAIMLHLARFEFPDWQQRLGRAGR